MKKIVLLAIVFIISLEATPQRFFRNNSDKKKEYIILTNPTVKTLKTINFLIDNKLLKINTRKIKFVGVYFENQKYDFSQTRTFIDTSGFKNYHLHEVKGELYEKNLFEENPCTSELKNLFNHSAGTFFFGGPDIPPGIYDEKNNHAVITDPYRHYFETTFLFHLLGSSRQEDFDAFLEKNPSYFITGFCLGMQTMNVATGGTLIQDIPAEIYQAETPQAAVQINPQNLHCNYWHKIREDTLLMGINFHPVQLTDHTFFGKKVKIRPDRTPKVYSSHHQAIEKLGEGLYPTAFSPDGKVIEAVAHKHYPHVFAVQFHPEVPALYKNGPKRKFHPTDNPASYNQLIGKEGIQFHKKYWKFVSKALKKAVRKNR